LSAGSFSLPRRPKNRELPSDDREPSTVGSVRRDFFFSGRRQSLVPFQPLFTVSRLPLGDVRAQSTFASPPLSFAPTFDLYDHSKATRPRVVAFFLALSFSMFKCNSDRYFSFPLSPFALFPPLLIICFFPGPRLSLRFSFKAALERPAPRGNFPVRVFELQLNP